MMKETRDFFYKWSSRKFKKDNRALSRYLIRKEGKKKFILQLFLLLFFAIGIYTQT